MCNLYSITQSQTAILQFTRAMKDSTGNLPSLPGIFPDYRAPVVANKGGIRELCMMRWGMPSSSKALLDATTKRADKLRAKGKEVDFKELLRMEPDGGVTNIRNTSSKHWTRWLEVENRCVVPFTSFSEFNKAEGGDIWFALGDDSRFLSFCCRLLFMVGRVSVFPIDAMGDRQVAPPIIETISRLWPRGASWRVRDPPGMADHRR